MVVVVVVFATAGPPSHWLGPGSHTWRRSSSFLPPGRRLTGGSQPGLGVRDSESGVAGDEEGWEVAEV